MLGIQRPKEEAIMTHVGQSERVAVSRMRISRSRGAASGFLVIVLGLWGALVPFVGPAFDFAYNPGQGSAWSAARGWLEVLPGVVALIGGLVLVRSGNRATAMLGGWLSVVAGAWFVVGRVVATTLTIGEIGRPVAGTDAKAAWLELTYFYGLGALIVFFGAMALGRLSVRSVRDVDFAERSAAARRDERAQVAAATAPTGIVSETPTGPVPHTATEADRPKRTWHNPLGRRRDNPTPVGQ
jgi:hypothetical protein